MLYDINSNKFHMKLNIHFINVSNIKEVFINNFKYRYHNNTTYT